MSKFVVNARSLIFQNKLTNIDAEAVIRAWIYARYILFTQYRIILPSTHLSFRLVGWVDKWISNSRKKFCVHVWGLKLITNAPAWTSPINWSFYINRVFDNLFSYRDESHTTRPLSSPLLSA